MEYTLIRQKRKTFSLTVNDECKVIVRAPTHSKAEDIDAFVAGHTAWIEKRLEAVKHRPTVSYREGDFVPLFGESYQVCAGRTRLGDGVLYLPQEGRDMAFKRLLSRLTVQKMGEMVQTIAQKYRFSYQTVRASSAKSRWGSCNQKGRIAFTFRTALLPLDVCEYLAVHELCHTKQLNHSPLFWQEVERILPDWRKRRKKLRALGELMHALPF